MQKVYSRPQSFIPGAGTSYCPGCLHSTATKVISEAIDELGIQQDVCYFQGVGCGALSVLHWDYDTVAVAHGRSCAAAGAFKRCAPDTITFTYQGDGDLAAIGLAETLSAANRGENITVFFINNATYGMTGGQLAPTTLEGMKATTAPKGRDPEEHGYPMHMCEIINTLKAPAYIARVTCTDVPNIKKAKEAVKKALQCQMERKGFSFVEFVSNCPTNWGMTPLETLQYIKEKMIPEYPLGEFRSK